MPAADAAVVDRVPAEAGTAADGSEFASTPAPPGPRARRRYLAEPTPWRRPHLVRAAVPAVVGAVIVAVCWYGLAGEVTLEQQQGWLVGTFLGAAIAALGGVYWLLVGLRGVRIGQRVLLTDIAAVLDWPAGRDGRITERGADGDAAEAATETVPLEVVTGPGMTLVHRPECPIARNKPVEPIAATEAAARGLTGCGMCKT